MSWYYYDESGKNGPFSVQQIRELVKRGIIKRKTVIENADGRSALAETMRLDFPPEPAHEPIPVPPMNPNPFVPPVQEPPPAPKDVFCTNCGNTISEQAFACMSCGAKPTGHKKFCRQCGVALNPEQVVCIKCGVSLTGGGFKIGGGFVANQNQSLLPIILAGLLVLLFFTPQLIAVAHAPSRSYSGFMGGFYDPELSYTQKLCIG